MIDKIQKQLFILNMESNKEETYWINKLSGIIEMSVFPRDNIANKQRTNLRTDRSSFELPFNTYNKIIRLTNDSNKSLYCILLAVVKVILYKYTNNTDSIIGSTVYKQEYNDSLVNNILLFRDIIDNTVTFKEYLLITRDNIREAEENQNIPLDILIENKKVAGIDKISDLFKTVVILDNIHDSNYLNDFNPTILFAFKRENSKVSCDLSFCTEIYEESTIQRIIKHFLYLLNIILNNIDKKLIEIDILPEEEKIQIISEFNSTMVDYPKEKTIQSLFEEQVEKTPNNIAVVYKENQLTYRELNEMTNSLANVLREKGVSKDSIVAIMTERSKEMILGILGVLKAGGAYLPIDPTYPQDRINYLINDSKVAVVLTTEALLGKIELPIEKIDMSNEALYKGFTENLNNINESQDAAYIIYTSGSTGNPKGVIIEHRSINNLVVALNYNIYSLYNKNLRVALVAPYYFDASVQQIFGALLNGHSLYIVPEDVRVDGKSLLRFYETNQIDISDGTPIHAKMISNNITKEYELKLKHLLIGGDILEINTVKAIYDSMKSVKLSNMYGLTECCVDSIIYLIDREKLNNTWNIPIGKPIVNSKVYIIGENVNIMPIGLWGELCISGVGLARGYLNRSEITEERFIDNPFEAGTRMFRTGDLARWLPDGNIEFLGRMDNQVKIRGFRIELGEIENYLLRHKNIKEAVVIAKEEDDKNKCLHAYILTDKNLSTAEIREYLSITLPNYMIPSYIIQMKELPLTPNGKVNRNALKNYKDNMPKGAKYEAPGNEIEKKLTVIWQEVLSIERVGINDNFFELGGHSLKAIKLLVRIQKEFNVNISLTDFFTYQTIKSMCIFIKGSEKYERIDIDIINDELKLQFGENCKVVQYKTELSKQLVLHTNANPGKVLNYIKRNQKGNIMIDYVTSYKSLTSGSVLQKITIEELNTKLNLNCLLEEYIATILDKVRCNMEELRNCIFKCKKIDKYENGVVFNKMCNINHVNNIVRSIWVEVNFKTENSSQYINRVLTRLINEQHVFRTVVGLEKRKYKFIEYDKIIEAKYSVIDLSNLTFADKKVAISKILEYIDFSLNSMDYINNLLYGFAIVKLSFNQYCFILSIDHQVADIHTQRIIKNYFEGLLDQEPKPLTYSHYIKNILTMDNISKYNIFKNSNIFKEYKESSENLYKIYTDYSSEKSIILSEPVIISYWVNPQCTKNSENISVLGYILYILAKIISIQFEIRDIPIRVLYNEHIFTMHNYYNTIGNFNDSVLCTLNADMNNIIYYYNKYEECKNELLRNNIRLRELNDSIEVAEYVYKLSPFSLNYLGDYAELIEQNISYRCAYPVQAYSINGKLIKITFNNGIKKGMLKNVELFMKKMGGRYKIELIKDE